MSEVDAPPQDQEQQQVNDSSDNADATTKKWRIATVDNDFEGDKPKGDIEFYPKNDSGDGPLGDKVDVNTITITKENVGDYVVEDKTTTDDKGNGTENADATTKKWRIATVDNDFEGDKPKGDIEFYPKNASGDGPDGDKVDVNTITTENVGNYVVEDKTNDEGNGTESGTLEKGVISALENQKDIRMEEIAKAAADAVEKQKGTGANAGGRRRSRRKHAKKSKKSKKTKKASKKRRTRRASRKSSHRRSRNQKQN